MLDGLQGFVSLVEGEGADARVDADLGGEREEVACVGARHVGDGSDLALAPEESVVVECWYLCPPQ